MVMSFYLMEKTEPCFGIKSDWDLKLAIEKNPDVEFFQNSDYTS